MFYYGYIFVGEDYVEQVDVKTFKMKLVGVADHADAVAAAKELVAEGVDLIELCGDFGPAGAAMVAEAIDDAVPVGGVMFGMGAAAGITKLPF
jgi:predicted polyphosphate/ATP-dependent NAD kinase